MDDADRAQIIQERQIEVAIGAARRRLAPRHALDCLGCGDEIPEARRRVLPGCCLCIDCQEDAERSMGR